MQCVPVLGGEGPGPEVAPMAAPLTDARNWR
jgi:hypothetical protein